ncbi:MAG: hypothetical protein H6712_09525 [Myxococcales bacterium]|nr:hypothetical protein [Myxococcales bacterium]MCB9714083.1 hypothetical protein [Myxococcales bacterium]
MSSRRAIVLASCLGTAPFGCQPPLPELEAEGERVVVGVQGDVELCAGTLRAWDQHVVSVETQLGIARDPDDRLEVYVVDQTEPWCQDVMACYIGGWADATFVPAYAPHAIWHELVHHVVSGSELGMTDRFLSEGLAGSLGDNWCPPPGAEWPTPPLRTLVARNDLAYEHYPRAAQLVDWIRQEHGTPTLVALVECMERGQPFAEAQRCFEQVLGADVDAVSDLLDEVAPPLHANPTVCDGPAEPWAGDTWSLDAVLACEDPSVSNGFRSRHDRKTSIRLDLPRAGNYAVVIQGDGDATIELEPCFCMGSDGGLLHASDGRSFWVGEPGRYRLVVRTDDPATSRVHVELWPLDVE